MAMTKMKEMRAMKKWQMRPPASKTSLEQAVEVEVVAVDKTSDKC